MSVFDEHRKQCEKCGGRICDWDDPDQHLDSRCIECVENEEFVNKVDILIGELESPNWELIAKRLWSLLDDIDTAFDHYKPNMKDSFVNYVNHKCRERQDYMVSPDGQTLQPRSEIPVVEDLDPMCKWFKDAWRIEKLKSQETAPCKIDGDDYRGADHE
jgi:hypothetical protein